MEKALLGLFPFPIVSINQKQVHFTVLIIIVIFLLIIIFPPVPNIIVKVAPHASHRSSLQPEGNLLLYQTGMIGPGIT